MMYILIVAGIFVCAVQAIRVKRLLISAIWLAGTSALVALMMYLLGAPEVAVIELSVGAGLVTVLFVFAINIAGEEVVDTKSLLSKPLVISLVGIAALMAIFMVLPSLNISLPIPESLKFATVLWEYRSLDVLLQIILIFAGVLGMLGLLSEARGHQNAKKEQQP
jgi:uncharacterized MnhB-related membrane protein